MRRLKLAAAFVLAATALSAAFATSAYAHPTITSPCNGCHSGTNVPVTATPVSNNGVTAVYSVSAPTATAVGVFNGSAKQTYFVGTSGQVSVPTGNTYQIFAVKGPKTSSGIGQTNVSPAATAADTIAPSTTSNAVATYAGSASITLSASDNAGGSGVAHTYYILDAGTQTAGTSVVTSVVGAHTLEYWSVDVAGNAETPHKFASFSVTAVSAADTTPPTTTSNAVPTYVGSASITLSALDNAGGSGVAHTYYILDGGVQTAGTWVVTAVTGPHTLEFWSVDVAANTETPHKFATFSVSASAAVDTTAPVTTSNVQPTYVGTATVTLSATDVGGSGVAHTYYILDAGPQTAGTSVVAGAVGSHTLEFWSVDVAANTETPHKFAAFSVTAAPVSDTTAPVTTSDVQASYEGTASITLSATDGVGGSGVAHTYYKLDDGVQTAGTSIVTDVVGTHTLEFWSVDASANAETPHKFASFSVTGEAATQPAVYSLSRTPTKSTLTYRRHSGVAKVALSAKLRHTGAPVAGVRVVLQQRKSSHGAWTTVVTLRSNTTGSVSRTIRKTARGTTYYRWYVAASEANVAASTSAQKVIVK